MRKKSAFTIFELTITMSIMALLAWYALQETNNLTRTTRINESFDKLKQVIDITLLDSDRGYARDNNGSLYCAGTIDYTNLSAERAIKCSGFENHIGIGGAKDINSTDGNQTYLSDIFDGIVYGGGKIYFDEDNNGSHMFYICVDLSKPIGDADSLEIERAQLMLESSISAKLKKAYSPAQNPIIYNKAIDINNPTGTDGNKTDGKFCMHFGYK
jgi:type II secretory pathway pseudopilin PulG